MNHFIYSSFEAYAECKIIAIPAKYDFKPYAYGFQKDSPFLPLFNYYLKDMREKGSLKQILKKYEAPPQVCPDLNGEPLGFGACFTAFGLVFFGLIGALILFLVEKMADVFNTNPGFLNLFDSSYAPEYNEANFMNILAMKDAEIIAMKEKIHKLESYRGGNVESWD